MHALGGFAVPFAGLSGAQRNPTRRATALVALAFAISTFGLFALPHATLAWAPNSFDGASEQELLTRTNQARASAGRRALRWDATLASIARSRSKDMIERDYFDHAIKGSGRYVWDLMGDRGYCYNLAGENIGWNQYWPDGQETAEIQRSFMGSPGHRDNLLGSAWDAVGIGAYKGADGKTMWTLVFADSCGRTASVAAPEPTPKPTAKPAVKSAAKPTVTVPFKAATQLAGKVTSIRESGRTVTWRWGAVDAATQATRTACRFDVLYRDNLGAWKFLRTRTTARSISIAGRTPGHTYTVKVRPRDCSGVAGTWSAPRAFTVR